MKICILSDSHDRSELLASAARESIGQGAEVFLHCGDVVEPETLAALDALDRPIHLVHGNNRGDLSKLRGIASRPGSGIRYYGGEADFFLGERRIFLSHYPQRARQMAATGHWELLCCGHSHAAEIARIPHADGEAIVVNPGTVGGIGAPATYALGDLSTWEFEIHTLSSGG